MIKRCYKNLVYQNTHIVNKLATTNNKILLAKSIHFFSKLHLYFKCKIVFNLNKGKAIRIIIQLKSF